jgi:predicted metalloprotease
LVRSADEPAAICRASRHARDRNFYDLLRHRFDVAGDFAQAYVIAHEAGHHRQNITGKHAAAQIGDDTIQRKPQGF